MLEFVLTSHSGIYLALFYFVAFTHLNVGHRTQHNKPHVISFLAAVESSQFISLNYQAIIHPYLSTKSRIQIRASLRGIYGGTSDTKTGVSSVLTSSAVSISPSTRPTHTSHTHHRRYTSATDGVSKQNISLISLRHLYVSVCPSLS